MSSRVNENSRVLALRALIREQLSSDSRIEEADTSADTGGNLQEIEMQIMQSHFESGIKVIYPECLVAGKTQKVMRCFSKGCATWVSDILGQEKRQGNAWHAMLVGGNLKYSAYQNFSRGQMMQAASLFSRINADPGSVSAYNDKVREFSKSFIADDQMSLSKFIEVGDVVGLYHESSVYHAQAFFEGGSGANYMGESPGWTKSFFMDEKEERWNPEMLEKEIKFLPRRDTLMAGQGFGMNTHLGIVGAIVEGIPVIYHYVGNRYTLGQMGNVYATPLNAMRAEPGNDAIAWIKSPAGPVSSRTIKVSRPPCYAGDTSS